MPNTTPIPSTFIESSAKYHGASTFKVFFFLTTEMLKKQTTPDVSVSGRIIAEHTGLSTRSVLMAIRELEADGHILRPSRSAFDVSTYRLTGFDETGLAAPSDCGNDEASHLEYGE